MSLGRELPVELDEIAQEFIARERMGERPTVSEYVRRYPHYEAGIREVFPMLSVMEGVKPTSGSFAPRGPAALDPEIEALDDYRLLRVVGRGGMGVVYEAEQETLGRRVALKVLPPSATLDPRFLERFRIEAQAAARLQHPHIVPVIGLGEDNGVHYYAMQFIDGHGLDEVLEHTRGLLDAERAPSGSEVAARLFAKDLTDGSSTAAPASETSPASPPSETSTSSSQRARRRHYHRNVARIGLQAAEALAFAHARGVLHRDVKPSNIMLDERGKAWITDFGLCREDESGGLTRTGDLVGTLRYMAPECFRGVYDVRGDVYGLGLTLYELLTGAPAFEGGQRAELVRKITQDTLPRLRGRDPSIPGDLATIVHKAMARDEDVRYPTVEALAADLRAYLDGRPIAARAPSVMYLLRSAVRRHRSLAITVAGAGVLLLASAVFYVLNIKAQEAQARLEHYAANIAAAETALRDGDVPGARRLLERAPEEFRNWEWRHLVSRLDPGVRSFESLSPNSARAAAHSPDGRWLAVGGERSAFVYDQQAGTRAPLPVRQVFDLAWSPDNTRVAVGTHGQLAIFSWPDGEELLRRNWPDTVRAVCFDRRGERILVGSEDCYVHALDATTFEDLDQVELPSKVLSIALSPDGRFVAAGRLDGKISLLDAPTLQTRWTEAVSPRGLLGVAFAGNERVVGTAYDGAVRLLRTQDGTLDRVLPHERDLWDVAASPEGRLLATVERGGRLHLWNLEERTHLEPRSHGREVSAVAFRPDGLAVVTTSWAGTVTEWPVYSGRDPHVLGGHLDGVPALALHPDGRIAASGSVGGILRLWDVETGEIVRTLPGHGGWILTVAFSPDGRWVASGSRDKQILVRRVEDGAVLWRLRGHERSVREIAFAPDGTTLFSASSDGTVCAWNPITGERTGRSEVSERRLRSLVVSPDGRRIATSGADRVIRILDAATLRVRTRLVGHTDVVLRLAYHPEGDVLASASQDKSIRLWQTDTGKALRVLRQSESELGMHTDAVQSVVFHPDGSRLVTGSRDASIQIWDWARGQRLSTLRGHYGWVHRVVFSRDGQQLVSCSSDGTLRIWDTINVAARAPALQEARRRRDAARPIVDALYARSGDLDEVIGAIEGDARLSDVQREAALRLAHQRLSTRPELKKWMWRVLTPVEGDPETRAAARCIAAGFARASDLRSLQDAEGYLLAGVANHRTKAPYARYYLERAITLNTHAPELQAVGLACLARAYATSQSDKTEEARAALARLDTLLAEHPEARTERVRSFHAQAKSALED